MLGRAVFILGMHRSGTSCLTGCLEECGLHLGEVNTVAPHNKKGNRENRQIMELHDEVLLYNRGSWDDPPRSVVWCDEHRRWRDRLLDDYRGLPVFGIKDPRTLLALDGWLDAGLDARFVGTVRHPLTVASSLSRRNGFDLSRSLELWKAYNERLLRVLEPLDVEIISFDLPASRYRRRVLEIASRLELADRHRAKLEFFDEGLRNQSGESDEVLPEEISALYRRLVSASDATTGA